MVDVAAEDADAFHKAPDRADERSDAQAPANQRQKQLCHSLTRVAEVKVMDPQSCQKDAQKTCRNSGFRFSLRDCLLCDRLGVSAFTSDARTGCQLVTAVGAKASTAAFLVAAFGAKRIFGRQIVSAIFTKHSVILL